MNARPQALIEPELAVADLDETVTTKWRGFIDDWDPVVGIHGWALVADAPLDPLSLELVVGTTRLARVETGIARSDIDSLLGVRVTPGFKFPPEVFARLARLRARRRDQPVRVRFEGTQVYLRGRSPDPTVGDLVDGWCQDILNGFTVQRAAVSTGDRLLARLAGWRAEADRFRELPLRPSSELDAGHLEGFFLSPGGELWFIGWMLRGAPTEFPFLLIDRQKHPGGAAVMQFERQDLASRFVGVIGVMDSGWAPPAVVKEFFVYAGADARLQLRANPQTKLLSAEAFLAAFKQAEHAPLAGDAAGLRHLLTSGQSWLPGNAAAAGIAAEASIDRLLLIPGLGCLVEGWAMCPSKRIESFEMKVGDTLLVAEPSSTYFRPRPDLAEVFGAASRVARAGFVTLLRGDLPAAVAGAPLLRVLYADGSSSVHAGDSRQLRTLDCLADSEEVLALYPSLRYEPFYPALLSGLQRHLKAHVSVPQALEVTPVSRVIVMRLPVESANRRLCFDFIARLAPLDPAVGVCLIADDTRGLPAAKLEFHELKEASGLPLSLYTLDATVDGFAALPLILAQLLADRFVYVDRGVVLTPEGWEAARASLRRGGHAVHFFEFIDDAESPDRIHGALSAGCFGWSTAALFAWLPTAPRFVRGVYGTNGLPPASRAHVFSGAAMRVEAPVVAPLADLIDHDILRAAR
jgi:hypothetical protein